MRLTINGRFLRARQTGVQRVARSLVQELDRQGGGDESRQWALLRPPKADPLNLTRVAEQEVSGGGGGQIWEQAWLPARARRTVLLSLCNTAPLLHPANVVMIHDAQVFSSPKSYDRAFRSWYTIALPLLGRTARKILTVSEFSRRELVRWGVADFDRIVVVPNGCDHLLGLEPDNSVVKRLALETRPYIVALSSVQEHKNIQVLLRAFARPELAGVRLVLVGREGATAFNERGLELPAAALFTGALSDAALSGLLRGAAALACPSLTEGFGLPPLEAMSLGCPVVVAPEGALPEVCGTAALYAAAREPQAWAEALADVLNLRTRASLQRRGLDRAAGFSWAQSGKRLLEVLRPLLTE